MMEEASPDIHFLRAPSNIIISGATGSGKTTLLLKLLQNWPFKLGAGKNILYFYNIWQPLFHEFIQLFPQIKFIQGLQLNEIRDNWPMEDDEKISICICDDLAESAVKNEEFAQLITVYGHHKGIINFFLTQNPFYKGPFATTISRNAHYFILLKTPHFNTLDILGAQLYGSSGPVKAAYQRVMAENQYGYLLIDVFCDNVKNRLRSNIFPQEYPMIIWRGI